MAHLKMVKYGKGRNIESATSNDEMPKKEGTVTCVAVV
jgi:hypothetical protein